MQGTKSAPDVVSEDVRVSLGRSLQALKGDKWRIGEYSDPCHPVKTLDFVLVFWSFVAVVRPSLCFSFQPAALVVFFTRSRTRYIGGRGDN